MLTAERAPRQVNFPGELGEGCARQVNQPPWALWRKLGRTWARNPNYDHGQWSKKRWRLEAHVTTLHGRADRELALLLSLGRRLSWALEHRFQGELQSLKPGKDFGVWTGPDHRRRLYLPDGDIAKARRYCGLMVDIVAEIRRLAHPMPHVMPLSTTEQDRKEIEQRQQEELSRRKRAELARYQGYLEANRLCGPAPPR